eukprot:Filipodium_phascolosomae@DN1619_c0_g1_i2.p1
MARGALAEIKPELDSAFSLFGGSIHGFIVDLQKDKMIKQKWRFKDWPDGHYSIVVFNLTPLSDDRTRLQLTHTNVPVKDRFGQGGSVERCENGFQIHYFDAMEKMLGYPRSQDD